MMSVRATMKVISVDITFSFQFGLRRLTLQGWSLCLPRAPLTEFPFLPSQKIRLLKTKQIQS